MVWVVWWASVYSNHLSQWSRILNSIKTPCLLVWFSIIMKKLSWNHWTLTRRLHNKLGDLDISHILCWVSKFMKSVLRVFKAMGEILIFLTICDNTAAFLLFMASFHHHFTILKMVTNMAMLEADNRHVLINDIHWSSISEIGTLKPVVMGSPHGKSLERELLPPRSLFSHRVWQPQIMCIKVIYV